ncbi:MAG: GCN5-related N-acetyltransferase [Bryobacterales bacterium]|nr:GCN5-related N-acetyltransferase [Bryobacterales bacterium]
MTEGYRIVEATLADVETIVRHRKNMFFDMGQHDMDVLNEMMNSFQPWLVEKMSKQEYRAWFAIAEDGSVSAGAGLWLMNWPPGLYTSEPWRGNILNVYTEPEHRRRGLARRLVTATLDWCGAKRIHVVILHASNEGRLLYEALGFQPTNEMRLILSGQSFACD